MCKGGESTPAILRDTVDGFILADLIIASLAAITIKAMTPMPCSAHPVALLPFRDFFTDGFNAPNHFVSRNTWSIPDTQSDSQYKEQSLSKEKHNGPN